MFRRAVQPERAALALDQLPGDRQPQSDPSLGRVDALGAASEAREELLAQIEVVLLNNASLTIFQRLRGTKGLKRIGRADLLIASIALAQQATLVTRNLRHFRQVPNLKAVNWVD